MTIVFASNDAADFTTAMEEHTNSSFFDSSLVSRGMRIAARSGGASPFGLSLPSAVSGDFWLHFGCSVPSVNSNSDGDFLSIYDANHERVAYLDVLNGYAIAYADGDSLGPAGTDFSLSLIDTMRTYDIKVSVGADITMEVYVGGALMSTSTAANTGGKGNPRHITFHMDDIAQVNTFYYFSEFLVADGESTIGLRLSELRPDTDGTYLDGVGTTAALADGDSATGVVMGAAGEKRSWNPTAYTGPASPAIHSVVTTTSVRIGGGDITSARQFLRIGGTDYTGSDQSPPNYVGNITEQWTVNPATSVAWSEADLSTFEAGIEARP